METSLSSAVRRLYHRAGRAFFRRRWQPLREIRHFGRQAQGKADSPDIGQALVSAIARGVGAQRVLLFVLDSHQNKLAVAASEGADGSCSISLQPSSPFLVWLGEQHRAVTAEEVRPLPQWQGLPVAEREALSALGCRLFVSMRIESANNAFLAVGSRKDDTPYTREEMECLELLAHHAAAVMEVAYLRHMLEAQRQELRQARQQLANSTRMTAIEEALFASAQEIEGSLHTLSALADRMRQETSEQNGSWQIADAVKAEAAHAYDALLPILDLAREGQATWSVSDLNLLLSSVVSGSGLKATESRIKLALQLDPQKPHVRCDEERLKQVFMNLISNALDAMPQEGLLSISTTVVRDGVKVKFTDTGIGIPPEHLERVFDAFFTTKPEGKGTGVGLASSRRSVERHGGTMTVASQAGKGTTVTILLPCSSP